MASGNDQEKTERATPKRREDARKKGQVAQSKEIPSALILLSALGFFFFGGPWMFQELSGYTRQLLQNLGTLHLEDVSTLHAFVIDVFRHILKLLSPLMLTVLLAGIAGNIVQVGFSFKEEALTPKLTKLNPITGLGKLVSLRSGVELIKSLYKILLIGGIAFFLVRQEIKGIPDLMQTGVGEIVGFIARVSFRIGLYVSLAMMVLACLDYIFQRWKHEKDLRMSKQEVKDEAKQRELDPKIKGRIRSIQLQLARQRMMEKVPEATVVVTNPTHLAVALKFDAKKMTAPLVVAKGADFIAERIKELAREHAIPMVENKPLARTLYKTVDVGHTIPGELYRAVAEILAYVYRLKGLRK